MRNNDESNALLIEESPYRSGKVFYIVAIGVLFLIAVALSIVTGVLAWPTEESSSSIGPKNVILMISDGFGPSSQTMARSYNQWKSNSDSVFLPLDPIQVGSSRTRSANSLVTDSAAGATAISCTLKTNNAYVAVDPNEESCLTILEASRSQHNMKTGLVVTSRITHATPASFNAHINNRDMEQEIARQQIDSYVDVMFGGGVCNFLPMNDSESCRSDDLDLIAHAKSIGYNVALTRNDFDLLSETPALALFTPKHMSYEIDRDPVLEPALNETTLKALDLLTQAVSQTDKYGFFLMVEGSKIDLAGHDNDAATHLQEILMYQDTVKLVKEYVDLHPGTIMVSVSDHETGGLSLAVQLDPNTYPDYEWSPGQLENVKHSAEYLTASILTFNGTNPSNESLFQYLQETVVEEGLGILDVNPSEINDLHSLLHSGNNLNVINTKIRYYLAKMVSDRALLGWTTHGHTGVDVNLYAHPVTSIMGNHDNTEVGAFIAEYLNLDLTVTP